MNVLIRNNPGPNILRRCFLQCCLCSLHPATCITLQLAATQVACALHYAHLFKLSQDWKSVKLRLAERRLVAIWLNIYKSLAQWTLSYQLSIILSKPLCRDDQIELGRGIGARGRKIVYASNCVRIMTEMSDVHIFIPITFTNTSTVTDIWCLRWG